ncbi:Nucleotide-diphospho-sugar transferase [Venustampulla echinocandica]|uniref:Nucleotide-diphospho-sugar transferase n=1 Tax=Venustampulla echinocandica TaxID=2656787 RepID=A0A370TX69_9HELO|nr:Nucleotide-diphospho-sugar transferase [Venustampulla echinocandica]RDL40126.1 Nucleotide-diphospho-sugar transferase [Venustampulla echinocandica]
MPLFLHGPLRPAKLVLITLVITILLSSPWLLAPKQWIHTKGLRLAFATLLLESNVNSTATDSDVYFNSVRILSYQLQHDKSTCTRHSIPFLVLTTPGVLPWKREQLSREGAIIVQVQKVDSSWASPGHERWHDVMAKLRVFELTDYDRVAFMDADTFLLKSLDGIFEDPAAQPKKTQHKSEVRPDEEQLPDQYVFATSAEVTHTTHVYPPIPMSYFNAGLFVLGPSAELFRYYTSLFKVADRFDTTYPEQNLLNYAHRQHGNMPWSRIFYGWNIQLPNMNDVKRGVASVHAKLWTAGNDLQPVPQELQDLWQKKKTEMERYYKA